MSSSRDMFAEMRKRVPMLPASGKCPHMEGRVTVQIMRARSEAKPYLKRAMKAMAALIAEWRKEAGSHAGLRSCRVLNDKILVERLASREIKSFFCAPPAEFFSAIAFQMVETYQSSIKVLFETSEAFRVDVAEIEKIFVSLGLGHNFRFAELIRTETVPGMGITCGLLYVAKETLFECDMERVVRCAVNSRQFLLEWAAEGVDAHRILRQLTIGGSAESGKRFGLGLLNPVKFQLLDEGSPDERLDLNPFAVQQAEAHFSELGEDFPYRIQCPALAVQQDDCDMVSDALNWASEIAVEHWGQMRAKGDVSFIQKAKRRRSREKKTKGKRRKR